MKEAEANTVGSDETSATILWWVWALTGGWGVMLALLVSMSDTCNGGAAQWWRLDQHYIACRSANEIGDFLAGAFAPLAFVWLIATVYIQSQELRAQRRELALTRREFAENRKVAQAQADEAKKQAEFIGTQTKLLEAQFDREQTVARDHAIDQTLTGLETYLRSHIVGKVKARGRANPGELPLVRNNDLPEQRDAAIAKMFERILRLPDSGHAHGLGEVYIQSTYRVELKGLQAILGRLNELRSGASDHSRITLWTLKLSETSKFIDSLVEEIDGE